MKKVFLKGLLMGICDLIPGISGGTIAFITGIYERLISAVKGFSFSNLVLLVKSLVSKKKTIKVFKKLDLVFLIVLFAGIGTSILLGSRVIKMLLEEHTAYTLAFFVGLIFASSRLIFNHIEKHHSRNILFGIVGLGLGVVLSILIPAKLVPTLPYVLLGGFIAISAMFLPGISGAFILLIMGLYDYLLESLHDFDVTTILVFAIGAVLGAVFISRFVSFLFRKDKCKTLYVLLGFVIGALSIPIKRIVLSSSNWTFGEIGITILFVIVGIMGVYLVNKK